VSPNQKEVGKNAWRVRTRARARPARELSLAWRERGKSGREGGMIGHWNEASGS
jgi:hypothetical protein